MTELSEKKRDATQARAQLRLSYAAETRRFEIERFWQRSLFFWTILGSAFVGYAAIESKSNGTQFIVACFGLVAALAWTLQNRGAKYLHEASEQKTNQLQGAALGMDLFQYKEKVLKKGLFGAARYSVSRIAIILSDFTCVIWLALWVRSIALIWPGPRPSTPCLSAAVSWVIDWAPMAMAVITLATCIALIIWGRSEKPEKPRMA